MYDSALYPQDPAAAEAFVQGQRHGTLIAAAPDGFPQASILPFVKTGDLIELHCVQEDPTFAALQANPSATFLVSDFLAFTRHDWIEPLNAARATLNFRAVLYECTAELSTNPDDVAAAMARLLADYEPDAEYRPIVNDDFYGSRLKRLATIRLHIKNTQSKFKVGPTAPVEAKREVIRHLRERNEPNDQRAADVIEAYLAGVD
ncbi:MAG: FMN-binding negative transcriptional regulator [Chloroflexota bacterium]